MVWGMVAAGRGGESPSAAAIMSWIGASVVGGAAWWVRRRWRIHHERRLIIDGRGITYVPFHGRSRVIPWAEVSDITEDEEWELGRWLLITHHRGRFAIESHAFHGYDEIRALARAHLPERTRLRTG